MGSYQARVGQAIRQVRESQHISQEELAHKAGIHRTYVGGVERGERNPTVTTLLKLAGALGMTPAQLLHRAEQLK